MSINNVFETVDLFCMFGLTSLLIIQVARLTRLGQRVLGAVILFKELEDGSGLVQRVLTLASFDRRIAGKDTNLNKT